MKSVCDLKKVFQLSDKMLAVIAYIFEQVQEVTPLALQKILYFIQGIHMVLFEKPLYPEDCQAWVHGPVYANVYYLFRNFKYSPIDDTRFVLFRGKSKDLTDDEKRVIDMVLKTFGMYSGKILESITHHEAPWLEARVGYEAEEMSNVVIPKSDMKAYFTEVWSTYGVDSVKGLLDYIESRLLL